MNIKTSLAVAAAVVLGFGAAALTVSADQRQEPMQPLEFVRFRINHYPAVQSLGIYMASQHHGQAPNLDLSVPDGTIVPCDGTGPAHPRDESLRMWTFGAVVDVQGNGGHDDMPSEHWDQSIRVTAHGPGVNGEFTFQEWAHANIPHHGRNGVFNPAVEDWRNGWEMSEGGIRVRLLDQRVTEVQVHVAVTGIESGNEFAFTCRIPLAP